MLRVRWRAKQDRCIYLVAHVDITNTATQRILLSVIARIYKLLGLLGLITMYAKLILQKLWEAELDWNEWVPEHIYKMRLDFCSQLNLINNLAFEWLVVIKKYIEIYSIESCDASEAGYGACLYISSRYYDKATRRLLYSKSKVSLLKILTTARVKLSDAKLLFFLVIVYNWGTIWGTIFTERRKDPFVNG